MTFISAMRIDPSRDSRRRREGSNARRLETLEGRQLMAAAIQSSFLPIAPPAEVSIKSAHHAKVATVSALRAGGKNAPVVDPSIAGSWSPVMKFKPPGSKQPYVAIHATLLPNGQVLAWPHDYNYFLKTKHAAPYTPGIMLWDPKTNSYSHLTLPNDNLFCSGSSFLPDGQLLILGGHGPAARPVSGLQTAYGNNHAELYNFANNTWTRAENMGQGRYYGSAITLGTGQVMVVAGYTEQGYNNSQVELYTEGQGWKLLTGISTQNYRDWYPHLYQMSNGLVFGTLPGKRTFIIDPSGNGSITAGPTMNYSRRYYGTSVMYDQNKILVIGGNAAAGTAAVGTDRQITKTAETIDMNSANPQWQYTGSMKYARFFPTATLLPDGTALVTGGTSHQDTASGNALSGAVYAGEIWNPTTGQWSTMNSMKVPRMYHSTALLLPDATVLVAGGGDPESSGEAKGTIHQNMQIFSPPYLFKGPRPVISSAPSTASYGSTISVTSPQASSIAQVNLVRLGSDTHGYNMTQKIVKLNYTQAADGSIQATMPTNPNDAPPGYYMLFILNGDGVPSVSTMLDLTS
jgi:N-acetylneuraminic acid mutarotase